MKIGDGHDLNSPRFAGDPVLEACYDKERYIRKGDRGPAVKKIQHALIDSDFPLPKFGADGIVGPITLKSLDAKFSSTPQPATGFSFLLRAGETIRDRMVRCCNEALGQAVIHWCGFPPMGPYKPGSKGQESSRLKPWRLSMHES